MAEKYRIPNFRKLYPEASDDMIAVLRKSERQMQYQEYDIKTEVVRVNQKKQTVTYIPSREDSLERLCENERQFAADQPSVEDEVMRRLMFKNLHAVLRMLSEDEHQLIVQLYFLGKTERELAELMALSQNAINKRRHKVLKKLRALLENN